MGREVGEAVGRINGAYGEASWTPVRYINKAHSRTALAGLYRAARAGLVTPLRDGMNLVAKEFVAAQNADDPGVLILSRFAGAAHECAAALLVNPYDPEGVGNAINRALSMPLEERRQRHSANFKVLVRNDLGHWAGRFLRMLEPPGMNDSPSLVRVGRALNLTRSALARRMSGGTASSLNALSAASRGMTCWPSLPSRRIETVRSAASFLPTTSRTGTLARECSRTL